MEFVNSFFQKDEKGKTGYERSGNRANLDRQAPANLRVRLEGVDLKKYENDNKPTYGQNYCLFRFMILEALEGNEQDVVEDTEYSIFFNLDTKTRSAAACAKEMESMAVLIADLLGESREALLRTGKETISTFLTENGTDALGNEFRLYTPEPNIDKQGRKWYRFEAEIPAPAEKKAKK